MFEMRRVGLCILVLVFLTSCFAEPTGYTFADNNLRCEENNYEGVFTFSHGFLPHRTFDTALASVRGAIDEEEWSHLKQGVYTPDEPLEFTDERGWVYLSVEIIGGENSWGVQEYQYCVPAES